LQDLKDGDHSQPGKSQYLKVTLRGLDDDKNQMEKS
jgi:hypothetical protein